jgi:hypothetical protein
MWPSDTLRPQGRPSASQSLGALRQVVTLRRRQAVGPRGSAVAEDASRGWALFEREIDRSRRYERPLAIGRIAVDPRAPFNADDVVSAAAPAVRTLDLVWADGRDVFVALPETRRELAVATMMRVARHVTPLLAHSWHLAVFPDDAWTVEALIDFLRSTSPLTPELAEVAL